MSASSELQKAIYTALQADVGLTALVGDRVYDVPPVDAVHPYISFGPSNYITERQDCFDRRIEVVQIDVWTRNELRKQPCKAICDAVVNVLDQGSFSLADPYGLGRCDLILARVMDDPDGITKHGVLQFECEVTNA